MKIKKLLKYLSNHFSLFSSHYFFEIREKGRILSETNGSYSLSKGFASILPLIIIAIAAISSTTPLLVENLLNGNPPGSRIASNESQQIANGPDVDCLREDDTCISCGGGGADKFCNSKSRGAICSQNYCYPSKRDNGKSCGEDPDCNSDICIENKCYAIRNPIGGVCGQDDDCAPAGHDRVGTCVLDLCRDRKDNAKCERPEDCDSGYCGPVFNTCTSWCGMYRKGDCPSGSCEFKNGLCREKTVDTPPRRPNGGDDNPPGDGFCAFSDGTGGIKIGNPACTNDPSNLEYESSGNSYCEKYPKKSNIYQIYWWICKDRAAVNPVRPVNPGGGDGSQPWIPTRPAEDGYCAGDRNSGGEKKVGSPSCTFNNSIYVSANEYCKQNFGGSLGNFYKCEGESAVLEAPNQHGFCAKQDRSEAKERFCTNSTAAPLGNAYCQQKYGGNHYWFNCVEGTNAKLICAGKGIDSFLKNGYLEPICTKDSPPFTQVQIDAGKFNATKAQANAYKDTNYYDIYKCADNSYEGYAGGTNICNSPPWTGELGKNTQQCLDPKKPYPNPNKPGECMANPNACPNVGPSGKFNICQLVACGPGIPDIVAGTEEEANQACTEYVGSTSYCCARPKSPAGGANPGTGNPTEKVNITINTALTVIPNGTSYSSAHIDIIDSSGKPLLDRINYPTSASTHTFRSSVPVNAEKRTYVVEGWVFTTRNDSLSPYKSTATIDLRNAQAGETYPAEITVTITGQKQTGQQQPGQGGAQPGGAGYIGKACPANPSGTAEHYLATTCESDNPQVDDYYCTKDFKSGSSVWACCSFGTRFCSLNNQCVDNASQCVAPTQASSGGGTGGSQACAGGPGSATNHCYGGQTDCCPGYYCSGGSVGTQACYVRKPNDPESKCPAAQGYECSDTYDQTRNVSDPYAVDACRSVNKQYCLKPAAGSGSGTNPNQPNFFEKGVCDATYFTCEPASSCPSGKRSSTARPQDNEACKNYDSAKPICCLKAQYVSTTTSSSIASLEDTCKTSRDCVKAKTGNACVYFGDSENGTCKTYK